MVVGAYNRAHLSESSLVGGPSRQKVRFLEKSECNVFTMIRTYFAMLLKAAKTSSSPMLPM
jgi:hypothetical protein